MSAERKPVDALAFGMMVLLCMLWGFQPITMKLAAPHISLVMQAGIRSILATLLLLVWARLRGIPLFSRDGTLGAGLLAGLLFGWEFFFIYAGLEHTGAARMIVLVNTAPCLTALGLAVAIPAVLAYNSFTRRNRLWLAQLDNFAHDLFALVTVGEKKV